MSYRIENFAPEDFWDIKIDLVKLKDDLKEQDYNALLDEEGLIDIYEVLANHGLRYVADDVWVRICEEDKVIIEVSTHEILRSFFYSPDQYEGVSAVIISKYIGLFAEVAEGQGGGLALIDCDTGEWIFSTKEFTVQHILWVAQHSVFIALHDVATYTWHAISLVIIKLTGEATFINLYKHDHLKDKNDYIPGDFAVLKKSVDQYEREEHLSRLSYDQDKDILHLYHHGHWICKLGEILDKAVQ